MTRFQLRLLVLLAGVAFVVGPMAAYTLAQRGPGGGPGGYDPNQSFDKRTKDGKTVNIADFQFGRSTLEEYAKAKGITNGVLTREQYLEAMAQAPQRGPGGGPGGPGGGKSSGSDPAETFNKLAKGGDAIVIAEQNQWFRQGMEDWAAKNGITNGKLTKDQYIAMSEEYRQKTAGGGGPRPPGPGGPGGGPGGPGGPGGDRNRGNERDRMSDEQRDAYEKERAQQKFNERDRDRDGVLADDEAPEELRADHERYDLNKNGVFEFDEYLAFYKDRMRFFRGERDGQGRDGDYSGDRRDNGYGQPNEQPRTTVYRHSNLPKELPQWFGQLDKDRDGQVALYEWAAGGQKIDDFLTYDRNADGYVTVEEVLKVQRLAKATAQNPSYLVVNGPIPTLPDEAVVSITGSRDKMALGGKGGKDYGKGLMIGGGNPPGGNPYGSKDKGSGDRKGPPGPGEMGKDKGKGQWDPEKMKDMMKEWGKDKGKGGKDKGKGG